MYILGSLQEVIFMDNITLDLTKEAGITLSPGDEVRLGRFSDDIWIVKYGWFSYGGNRPQYGWYLVNFYDTRRIKPLQLTDVPDIYMIR